MELTLLAEIITVFIIAAVAFIEAIRLLLNKSIKKTVPIIYFRLFFYFFTIMMLLGGLSLVFNNEILSRLCGIMLFPLSISLIIAINYLMRESYYSISLIIVFCLGILYTYEGIKPESINTAIHLRYAKLFEIGLFGIIFFLFTIIICFYFLYWAIKTRINAPILIKKEASYLLYTIVFAFFGIIIFYLISFIEPIYFLFCEFFLMIAVVMFRFSILREPKLLYILPFTIYHILVKDKEGYPLFDHDWAESNINERLFTGFINSVQIMSEEVMKVGGLLDINLKEGILTLNELDYITVGLVASKSSGLLKDSLMKFSADFENKFQRELKKSIRNREVYSSAYELIEKYFSNFPYKNIRSKKDPLLLTIKQRELPLVLDNKLKEIFKDDEDYMVKKEELLKIPNEVSSSFFDLYEELRDKTEDNQKEEDK